MTFATPHVDADELDAPTGAPLERDDPILSAYDRPPAAAGEQPGLAIGPDEVTAFGVAMGDMLAKLRGEHWRIEPSELALPAPAIARQLNKPDTAFAAWLAAHADAVLIAVGLGAIVVPRAVIEYQVIRYRREQLAAAAAQQVEVPFYGGFEPGNGGAGAAAPSGYDEPAAGGADAALREDGGGADTRPTDPRDLAAAVGSVLGG